MNPIKKSMFQDIALSMTIFSMFFGAGNAVFPLVIGLNLGEQVSWGVLGIIGSGIILPFLGVSSVILNEGQLNRFLKPMGKWPALMVSLILVLLLGPVITLPRCVTIAHASILPYWSDLSLPLFSVIFCFACYLCVIRPNQVVTILGKLLSPVLFVCLTAIIIFGMENSLPGNSLSIADSLTEGFVTGYNTLDLLAGLFIAPAIWRLHSLDSSDSVSPKRIIFNSLGSFAILGFIYWGLARVAAGRAAELANVEASSVLPHLSQLVLGPLGSVVANIAVCLACLTTVVGLTLTIGFWMQDNFKKVKDLNIPVIHATTLLLTLIIAQSGFANIMIVLEPLLSIVYPCMITLTLGALVTRFTGFIFPRSAVLIVAIAALFFKIFGS